LCEHIHRFAVNINLSPTYVFVIGQNIEVFKAFHFFNFMKW